MYAVADTLPYSMEVDQLMHQVSAKIDQGLPIEDETIWVNLLKLEPYRMHHRVQETVKIWVDKSAKKISNQRSSGQAALTSLQSVSQAYHARDFEKTVQECKKILSQTPKHLDIRSNMALALMHLNKDLCAQIELEIVVKLSETHIPAMLNLTVVYEKANRRKDAENMASKLSQIAGSKNLDVPLIRHNVAWYHLQNGDYRYADTLLIQKNQGVR